MNIYATQKNYSIIRYIRRIRPVSIFISSLLLIGHVHERKIAARRRMRSYGFCLCLAISLCSYGSLSGSHVSVWVYVLGVVLCYSLFCIFLTVWVLSVWVCMYFIVCVSISLCISVTEYVCLNWFHFHTSVITRGVPVKGNYQNMSSSSGITIKQYFVRSDVDKLADKK